MIPTVDEFQYLWDYDIYKSCPYVTFYPECKMEMNTGNYYFKNMLYLIYQCICISLICHVFIFSLFFFF